MVRKDVDFKLEVRETETPSQPTKAQYSPSKSGTKSKPHELNTTYKISRENSIPINIKTADEPEPFVVDGAGEPDCND